MKIAFFSEIEGFGKVARTNDNMRVEFAQMCAFNADHYPLVDIKQVHEQYDIAILLIGKTKALRDRLLNIDLISEAKKIAKKVVWMQEGPHWIFQDLPIDHQFWHYQILFEADGILCENKTDIPYFKGILWEDKWVHDIPSLMITDSIQHLQTIGREEKVIIGGNFVRWYGGFDSYICARDLNIPIWAPSMGRKIQNEESIADLNHLPYMNWLDWMKTLATFKYAIHLMPTTGAGTFPMNCAYLGIPCVAYNNLDTQVNLHPDLAVNPGDIQTARKLLNQLKMDVDFYNEMSSKCKLLYDQHHSEEFFIKDMQQKLNTL